MYCMCVCIVGECEASASDFSSGECTRRPIDPDPVSFPLTCMHVSAHVSDTLLTVAVDDQRIFV